MIVIHPRHILRMSKRGYFDNLKTATISKWNEEKQEVEYIKYIEIYGGFDVETTTIDDRAYIYSFAVSFYCGQHEIVFWCRTWHDFELFISRVKSIFALSEKRRLILWIANTSFEFSFMLKHFVWSEIFAREKRQPLVARTGGLEFRECLTISGGSLAYLAKNYCVTEKMVGDLDYSIIRNSKTPINSKEYHYIINDVVILAEWSKYIFDTYIRSQHYIPLTKTNVIRHNMKRHAKSLFPKKEYKKLKEWVHSLFPKSKEDYLFVMDWLFRGGYVHGRFDFVLMLLFNIHSFDKKSSYPWSMLTKYMPMSPWHEVKIFDVKKYYQLIEKCCVIAVIKFDGVTSRTRHSLESKSKCLKVVNPTIDNGRINSCDSMTVFITELDFQNYDKWYKWEKMTVLQCHISKRGYLPAYVRDGLYKAFEQKENINKYENPRDYEEQKKIVNGYYGMTVTRLPFFDIVLKHDIWQNEPTKRTYDDLIKNEILSPFWGVYVCAHSRKSECDFIIENHNDILYGDTDSGKGFLTPAVAKWLNTFNRQNKIVNRHFAEKWGYSPEVIEKLGCFEWETSPHEHGVCYWFKYGGAKRYICQYQNDGFKSTIAGLPKNALNDYCIKHDKNAFSLFDKDMNIPEDETGKLRARYIDEPTKDVVVDNFGNVETMSELTSVCLLPCEFTMSFDKDWLKLLAFHLTRFERFL